MATSEKAPQTGISVSVTQLHLLSLRLCIFSGYRNKRWHQQEGATQHRLPSSTALGPLCLKGHVRSRAVAKEGQQGEPGWTMLQRPWRWRTEWFSPSASDGADQTPASQSLVRGQRAAGGRARPHHAPVRSPQGLRCCKRRAGRCAGGSCGPLQTERADPWSRGGNGAWTPRQQEEQSRARFTDTELRGQ